MNLLFLLLGVVVTIYCLLPNLYARYISPRVLRNLHSPAPCVALTFDDGPDPAYTPALLDLLQAMEVRATFFLIAGKAMENRDLMMRIREEGHEIGLHSFNHHPAWLSSPLMTWRDFKRSVTFFHAVNIPLLYFRPPWGTFNLCTLCFSRGYNLQTVLWSVEARDWSRKATVERIHDALLSQVGAGSIIVLHDSGGAPGSPRKTLDALAQVIPQIKNQGLEFVTLGQGLPARPGLSRSKFSVSALIRTLDHWLTVLNKQWVLDSPARLLSINLHRYQGSLLSLSPQEHLRRGDLVAEIHINNAGLPREGINPRKARNLFRSELDALARSLQSQPAMHLVRAVHCQTIFHPILAREGFLVRPISGRLRYGQLYFWENLLRQVYTGHHSDKRREPRECWVSRDSMLRRIER